MVTVPWISIPRRPGPLMLSFSIVSSTLEGSSLVFAFWWITVWWAPVFRSIGSNAVVKAGRWIQTPLFRLCVGVGKDAVIDVGSITGTTNISPRAMSGYVGGPTIIGPAAHELIGSTVTLLGCAPGTSTHHLQARHDGAVNVNVTPIDCSRMCSHFLRTLIARTSSGNVHIVLCGASSRRSRVHRFRTLATHNSIRTFILASAARGSPQLR